MTHAEVSELLPLYALNALDEAEIPALEEHVSECDACAAELRSFESVAGGMGSAVPVLTPPAQLRERLLASAAAHAPDARSRQRGRLLRFPSRAPSWLAAAVLVVALASAAAAGFARDAADRAQLRTDDAALALLTSTETTVDRLEPVASGLPANAHGHWYHRDGVSTQVIVGEFLPPLGGGQQYAVWERTGQAWQRVGELDSRGRLVLLGSDGSRVVAVEVTRDAGAAAQPRGDVVLRFVR